MAKRSTVADTVDWREEFWDFENRIFLDCANQGPFPRVTIRAVQEALEFKKYPERISNQLYIDLPEQTRTALAQLIGAKPTEIALTNGAGDGVNAAARGLDWKVGDEIILPVGEFPANYYSWKNLEKKGVVVREVGPGDGRFVTAEDLIREMSDRTRLVAASYVGYSDSNRIDLGTVGAACRERGIYLLADASQAVGALDFKVADLQCDFLACSGYKWLFSPYGTGFFYLREELTEKLEVGDIRWLNVEGAENFNRLPREGWRLAAGARKWDAVEVSNFLNLSAMRASLEFLQRIGVKEIERHNRTLMEYLLEKLPRDRCVLRSPQEAERRGPFVCLAGRSTQKTAELWEALRKRNIFASLRQDALRIAPNIYNREWEIDRVLEVLTD